MDFNDKFLFFNLYLKTLNLNEVKVNKILIIFSLDITANFTQDNVKHSIRARMNKAVDFIPKTHFI